MKSFLIIFLGGGLGSATRYTISRLIGSNHAQAFPLATLISNITACFILGLVVGLADDKQLLTNNSRLFWTVGFCGGFSTFSTFSNETILLFQQGAQLTSIVYIFVSILLCLAFTLFGQVLARI
jgi:fluoride exporter